MQTRSNDCGGWSIVCTRKKLKKRETKRNSLTHASFNSWLTLTTLIRQANLYLSLPFRKQDKGAHISGLLRGGRGVGVNGGGYVLIL